MVAQSEPTLPLGEHALITVLREQRLSSRSTHAGQPAADWLSKLALDTCGSKASEDLSESIIHVLSGLPLKAAVRCC